jgi:formylglycine-generating enzyme required for sulfatase activity
MQRFLLRSVVSMALILTLAPLGCSDGDGDVCGAGSVLIPGGTYMNGGWPQAERTVGDVCMDQDEVTVAEFTACVADGGCTSPLTGYECNYGMSGREDHPVNCVDWFQAGEYCAWSGQRLPTEWEWEWAARGRDEGRTYPWGEATPTCEYAVMFDVATGCREDHTSEVGSKSPTGDSRDGLRDMAGNAWEWTGSWYDYNEVSRVGRGGGWVSGDTDLRADDRSTGDPSRSYDFVGFRCATTR